MDDASMQKLTIAELIFEMQQEIEDTINAFAEGEYGVAIGKDEEAKLRSSAIESKKNPSVKHSPEASKTFDFGPLSPHIDDQTDQIAVKDHSSIPTRDETMVQADEKTHKRKLAIANWDWENVVDLTNTEDGTDVDGKADSDSDELADSADSVLFVVTKFSIMMKEKQEICQEKVISVESPKKLSEGVSANMKQHDNSKPIALKSEKPANFMRHFEKHGKRKQALMNWKWDDVVDISSSDDEAELIDMTQPLFESAHYESDSNDNVDSVNTVED
ncbi:hypothetical protein L1987_51270 [Smallanthus sonchifolius]|uniref:Uncharacterized protein n=1 Tax=Smallanthus sonchifolius TaxID=185202 RepID=A0ACB9EPC1_9ASTR|nr:hypothetical protein L1987_51270 [Smallanthus sonchifolius]